MRDEIAAAIQKQTDQYIAATEKLGNNISSHMQEGFNSLGNGIERINQRLPSLPAGQQRIIMQEPEPDQGPRNEGANVIIDVVVDGEPAPVTEKPVVVTETPEDQKVITWHVPDLPVDDWAGQADFMKACGLDVNQRETLKQHLAAAVKRQEIESNGKKARENRIKVESALNWMRSFKPAKFTLVENSIHV